MWPRELWFLFWAVAAAAVALEVNEEESPVQIDAKTGRRMYEGYQLIRAKPETQEHLSTLRFLEKAVDDVWTTIPYNVSSISHVDMMVSPQNLEHIKGYLNCTGLPYSISIENLQRSIDEENVEVEDEDEDDGVLVGRDPESCAYNHNFNWRRYHRVSQIEDYCRCLSRKHGDKVQMMNIGRSSEGRNLFVLKIGKPTAHNKPAVWIDGGIHAREWISPASVTYMIYQLVENYGQHRDLLEKFDVYIMPVVNPDGYEYTHTHDRFWRKTRSRSYGARCVGTDPNRNWDYHWGEAGASDDSCRETYMGPRAFSEPETSAVRDFIKPRGKEIFKMFLTFHSYGQYILYPWGYTKVGAAPNTARMQAMGQIANRAMGSQYTVGSAAKLLYPAAGGSDDWAKGVVGIDYSYTIELPDTGRYGFVLPAQRIKNVAEEAFNGVRAMISELTKLY